jgi:hypothetical protein
LLSGFAAEVLASPFATANLRSEKPIHLGATARIRFASFRVFRGSVLQVRERETLSPTPGTDVLPGSIPAGALEERLPPRFVIDIPLDRFG